jgi:hypothetical protein
MGLEIQKLLLANGSNTFDLEKLRFRCGCGYDLISSGQLESTPWHKLMIYP